MAVFRGQSFFSGWGQETKLTIGDYEWNVSDATLCWGEAVDRLKVQRYIVHEEKIGSVQAVQKMSVRLPLNNQWGY